MVKLKILYELILFKLGLSNVIWIGYLLWRIVKFIGKFIGKFKFGWMIIELSLELVRKYNYVGFI